MNSKSAPDYDAKSRGLPTQLLVTGAVIVAVIAYISQWGSQEDSTLTASLQDEAEEGNSGPLWLLWWALWCLLRLTQLILGLGFLLLLVLVVRQRSIIYVPAPPGTERSPGRNPGPYRSPRYWKMPYEDAWIPTEDGTTIHGWLIYQSPEQCVDRQPYTFIYFHGNAGNIGHRLENLRDMHAQLGVNILIVDYRAYGDSEDGCGPCEAGFMMDARGAYKWLLDRIRNPPPEGTAKLSEERILIFGRSIGGAVGIQLFAHILRESLRGGQQPPLPLPAGIVLENTFTTIKDVAVCVFPFLKFVSLLLRKPLLLDEWKSTDSLKFLAQTYEHWSCCLLSGLQDEFVPPIQMVKLHAILKENRPKNLKFFKFQRGGHNDTPQRAGAEYWTSFQKFMALVASTEEERREGIEALRTGSKT